MSLTALISSIILIVIIGLVVGISDRQLDNVLGNALIFRLYRQ